MAGDEIQEFLTDVLTQPATARYRTQQQEYQRESTYGVRKENVVLRLPHTGNYRMGSLTCSRGTYPSKT